MCGNVKHDEYGNHIEEEQPIEVTEEFETLETEQVEVTVEEEA